MTFLEKQDLAARMAELARSLAGPRSLDEVLSGVSAAALELIPGVDAAGVLLIGKERTFETVPKDARLTTELHRLQMQYDEGPCVQAALDDLIVRTDDFRTEDRWPRYAPACVEIGVLSGLSFKLYTSDRTAGALNLFGFQPNVWRGEAETIGVVLAAHAAAAILASQEGQQLEAALSTRDRIGQAKGIIMERYKVNDVQAFEMLRQVSQESNTKLVQVAQQVIDTRD
ncbi:GAF and ANTAR domain-containing protein [Mycolicibacterium diernhoferi]|uniref:ANTAR domain-containing protein n=1 Tax=Mycolicibacterium diernhoferi TaxID=1801 RepID=A0A1Q4HIB7_9MYCO|nr:GAF and ANTAR domain-containing protein [Mycolicibacterium diernhoferi]OJZ67131.1 hypothetical protein BRW64_07840 [Mycolicibacterium diernhoferi]OPE55655.1 hypothetical protein BV510_03960 [Mycolicibacterium diernhoferi]PEG53647.1 hypothetical protein CRI78_14875 [Mycolicibacterium diernhoferi]QYL23330.1 GAF and ANTAR domain-containing protein [Mycolicibacterium diernhoferi]